jgi:hypothetical protein
MAIPAGRYPITHDLDNATLTGTTTTSALTVNGNFALPNLPGPYGNDSTAASNGVVVGQCYYDGNGHVKYRVA